MSDSAQEPREAKGPPAGLCMCLQAAAWLAAGTGSAAALARLLGANELTPVVAIGALGLAIAGCGAGCALWALSWLVRRQYENWLLLRNAPREHVAPTDQPELPQTAPEQAALLNNISRELAELNANFMLSPHELEVKRARHRTEAISRLEVQTEQVIGHRDFKSAVAAITALGDMSCPPELLDRLQRKFSDAKARADREQFEKLLARVRDMMAAGDFNAAQKTAESALAANPSSVEAISLLDRVRREEAVFTRERRHRLYHQIESDVEARRYAKAMEAARELLKSHPDSPEAESVLARMPTLEANARLEEVRHLRDELKDLIARRRYAEALAEARRLLTEYPETAAAEDIRRQLPRLEELARGDEERHS